MTPQKNTPPEGGVFLVELPGVEPGSTLVPS